MPLVADAARAGAGGQQANGGADHRASAKLGTSGRARRQGKRAKRTAQPLASVRGTLFPCVYFFLPCYPFPPFSTLLFPPLLPISPFFYFTVPSPRTHFLLPLSAQPICALPGHERCRICSFPCERSARAPLAALRAAPQFFTRATKGVCADDVHGSQSSDEWEARATQALQRMRIGTPPHILVA